MAEHQQKSDFNINPGMTRSKVVTWEDPAITIRGGRSLSGLQYLQTVVDGDLPGPPMAALLGMRLIAAETGHVTFACEPDESTYNPLGTVHGGLVCALLDSAAGCALHSVLDHGKTYTSVEIKVNYLKAIRAHGGVLTATGRVVKAGARLGFTEAGVTDASGSLVATATSTLLIFDH